MESTLQKFRLNFFHFDYDMLTFLLKNLKITNLLYCNDGKLNETFLWQTHRLL